MTTPPAAGPAGPTVPQRADFHPRYTFTEISTIAKARNRVGILLYNTIVTHLPSHTIRQAFLRAFGAKIGKDTSILRGCQVFDIDQIRIGEACSIGFRVLFDARSGICIGDNVVIASDTQIIAGKHDPASPEFAAVLEPVHIGDYAWIASRATIVSGVSIGRGAVVAACALVSKDVADLDIVGGVPATTISRRPESALRYRPKYRPLFY
ncbi:MULTISPECIES: acyltransferase [Gordonia]|nr:acetyltransferase [Gordonia sp. 1D]KAF0968601.1 2,3,4,5-tetrahydropyridine-2,6-dicarboxylate N-acetyltransferase [Gordonia sp. YY1]MBA5845640.1 acyltransferase [Gordonia amicalis]NKX77392.1 acyltransferase [Gordonia amicalis]